MGQTISFPTRRSAERVHVGRIVYRRDMLATLQRRELLLGASQLSDEVGKSFAEAMPQELIQGRLVRAVDMTSGRHALIERSRDFTLVPWRPVLRSEEHTSELQSLMRISYAVFCLKKKKTDPAVPRDSLSRSAKYVTKPLTSL